MCVCERERERERESVDSSTVRFRRDHMLTLMIVTGSHQLNINRGHKKSTCGTAQYEYVHISHLGVP